MSTFSYFHSLKQAHVKLGTQNGQLCHFEYVLIMLCVSSIFPEVKKLHCACICDVSPGEAPSERLSMAKEVSIKFQFLRPNKIKKIKNKNG